MYTLQHFRIFWCSCAGWKGQETQLLPVNKTQPPQVLLNRNLKVVVRTLRVETGRERSPRAHGNQRPRPLSRGRCSAQRQEGGSTSLSCGLRDRWEGGGFPAVDLFGDSP